MKELQDTTTSHSALSTFLSSVTRFPSFLYQTPPICNRYQIVLYLARFLTVRLLQHDYTATLLKPSLYTFYGHNDEFIGRYRIYSKRCQSIHGCSFIFISVHVLYCEKPQFLETRYKQSETLSDDCCQWCYLRLYNINR